MLLILLGNGVECLLFYCWKWRITKIMNPWSDLFVWDMKDSQIFSIMICLWEKSSLKSITVVNDSRDDTYWSLEILRHNDCCSEDRTCSCQRPNCCEGDYTGIYFWTHGRKHLENVLLGEPETIQRVLWHAWERGDQRCRRRVGFSSNLFYLVKIFRNNVLTWVFWDFSVI